MLARTDSRARALVLLIVVALVGTAIGARLVWWQVVQHEHLSEIALRQLAQHQELPAERGEIRDVNGELLATSVELQSVFATPPTVRDPEATARVLARLLDMPFATVRDRLESDNAWVWLKRRVSPDIAKEIRELGLRGIGMLPETKRVYPVKGVARDTTIAAQLIGFVDVDGRGQYGVEGRENALLAGAPGQVSAQEDVIGRRIADSATLLVDPVDGADLRLTIDVGVQHLLEQEMWATYRKNRAVGVTGLIMDAETGAVLGMASYPSYDANQFATTDGELFANPAIARQYEPGSVMKAFTVAAALDADAITTRDRFEDDNNLRIGAIRIQNADRYDYPYGRGRITAAEVLALSNNVGAAKIGLELGRQELYQAFLRYGFGSATGIELANEASGKLWNPDGPNASGDLTAAQTAFGQGLSVTAVQLAAGYAAFANGGTLVTPHVVAGWTDPDGTHHDAQRPPGERIMRPETAETMVDLLVNAIDDGIARGAQIPGYTVAGKTGTAQIAGPVEVKNREGETVTRWQYIDGWVDSSYIGFLPNADRKLVTLVLLHRPSVWGRYQMAERPETVYSRLMSQVLDYLAIPPDRPLEPVAQP
ncbi:MAG TPA: penicillin-binding protein 2 [Candidatus Limnocylindrales bacterium]|jgi:cell division protein FtsI (penicillin-binding protein 3)|nr:penicillin-binding protein 2 [Candidatus Limnocylindrales bacterium]